LSAFVGDLKLTLGNGPERFVVVYNDDLLVHSKYFEEHLTRFDISIGNLPKVRFIVNAVKCPFCRDEEKLLRHCINRTGVSANPDRVEAILNYPAPRNNK
jgi:hypothetical protein